MNINVKYKLENRLFGTESGKGAVVCSCGDEGVGEELQVDSKQQQ